MVRKHFHLRERIGKREGQMPRARIEALRECAAAAKLDACARSKGPQADATCIK
jgi:hypothetical protein